MSVWLYAQPKWEERGDAIIFLVSSEPIGNDDIWEEVPEGVFVLDEDFVISIHHKPTPFWITWPECVTMPPVRDNVIPALSIWEDA